MEGKVLKTGTTTLGIVCKDAILLAADKKATGGNFIASVKMDKVIAINDDFALTTAGTVSDIQLFVNLFYDFKMWFVIRINPINKEPD